MDYLVELQEIANELDKLYDKADDLYSAFKREQPDLDCMVENLAMLQHDIANACGFAKDILPDMQDIDNDFSGDWDEEPEVIDGEFEDSSLDDSAEGEWR